jgi:hypothetical protein
MADVQEGNPGQSIKKGAVLSAPFFFIHMLFYILSITIAVAPPPPLQIPATPVPAFF